MIYRILQELFVETNIEETWMAKDVEKLGINSQQTVNIFTRQKLWHNVDMSTGSTGQNK